MINGYVTKPLVSFCLKSYNQHQFIGDAIDAAFRQTYSPLEIIISDDASTDGSVGLIQSKIDHYYAAGGCHKVIFLENEKNLGIMLNCQKLYLAASGELIVNADGDDISFDQRVEKIVDTWIDRGCPSCAITHNAITIQKGMTGGGIVCDSLMTPLGAMMAYTPDIVRSFKNISYQDACDDDVFAHRSLILGEHIHIDTPLIYYRIGFGDSNGGPLKERRIRVSRRCIDSYHQTMIDLAEKKSEISSECYADLENRFNAYFVQYKTEYEMYANKSILMRMVAFYQHYRGGGGSI